MGYCHPNIKEKFDRMYIPEPNTGCWLWTGDMQSAGYGRITHKQIRYFAHRFSYEIYFGSIKSGMFICHKCDTPACVNPQHLFMGTPKDNCQDMARKGRALKKLGPQLHRQGSKHHNSKLSEREVLEIRDAYKNGMSQLNLCLKYKMSKTNISLLVRRRIWKHI